MKLISTTFALMLMASGVVFAADKHDHGHGDKPLHGGLVTEIKDMDYEPPRLSRRPIGLS